MVRLPPLVWEAIPAESYKKFLFDQLRSCLVHPDLDLAICLYCHEMMRPMKQPLATKFMNQFTRVYLCSQIVADDVGWRYGRARSTLTSLQSIGIESARQTAQHVAVMRRLGLVSKEKDAADRRRFWLVPTARMISGTTCHMRHAIAMDDLLSGGDLASRVGTDSCLFSTVFAKAWMVQESMAELRIAAFPVLEKFWKLDGGYMLLVVAIGHHLGRTSGGTISEGFLSWIDLSVILQVSRSQVANLLRMADIDGYFLVRQRRLVAISSRVVDEYRRYLLLQMLNFRAVGQAFS